MKSKATFLLFMVVFLSVFIFNASAEQITVTTAIYNETNPFSFEGGVLTSHDGITYETSGNGIVTVNGSRYLAFGLTGEVNSNPQIRTSMDYTWTWTSTQVGDDYVFHATNNDAQILWNQTWYFYKDFGSPMKIEHYLENNLAMSITDTQLFYFITVDENDVIRYNDNTYPINNFIGVNDSFHRSGNFNNEILSVDFNHIYDFNFNDLVENGFTVNEFYIGDAGFLDRPAIDVMAIGFTKGGGIFPSGFNITVDPNIVVEPDTYAVAGEYAGLLTSENVYTTGFTMTDISSSTSMTSTQYTALSTDDTSYATSGGSVTNDGFIYVNFSVPNVESINWFDIEIVGIGSKGWYIGALNESDSKWHTLNNTATATEVTMTYNVTGTDITNYSVIDGNDNANFSIALWTSDDLNSDIIGDLITVTFDYEAPPVPPTPIITSNYNNKTNNDTLSLSINVSEVVNFNVTANQSIDLWRWFKDDVNQTHNFDNLTTSWAASGIKTLSVNGTNSNGTTSTIEWTITVLPDPTSIPNITLVSFSPSPLQVDYVGGVQIDYMVVSNNPLNYTSLAFLYGVNFTTTGDMQNYAATPYNSIAFEGIYRAPNRNITPYLTWEFNDTITEGNVWKWGGGDNTSWWIVKNQINETHTWINCTGITQHILPSSFYLQKTSMYSAAKTPFEINRAQGLIFKVWNVEEMRNRDINYLINLYFDTSWESTLPGYPIEIGLCNGSYDPTVDDIDTCDNCSKVVEWDGNRWVNHSWVPGANASHAMPLVVNASEITNPTPDEVNYVWLRSEAVTSSSYVLNATNADPGICNLTYAQTETFWTYNEANGVTSASAYTPSFFMTFSRDYLELLHHVYIADDQGVWGHSEIFSEPIGISTYPPYPVSFEYFNTFCDINYEDREMDATYNAGTLGVGIHSPADPDSPILNHNLTLHYYPNLTLVAVINDTFTTNGEEYVEINFTTTPYYSSDGLYTLKCVSTDSDNNSATQWLVSYFALDQDGNRGWVKDSKLLFWGMDNFPTLYSEVGNSSLISYNGTTDIYTSHVPLFKSKGNDTFNFNETLHLESLNDSNVSFFRFVGRTNFDNATILGWNTTTDSLAPITDEYRAYVYSLTMACGNITNSNFSHLGADIYRQEGLNFVGNSHPYLIHNSTFSHNGEGPLFEECTNFTISNCTISDNLNVGIGVYFSSDFIIENNTIDSNAGYGGISVYEGFNNTIRYNNISNSGLHGIRFWSGAGNNTCTGNDISTSGVYDYYYSGASLGNYLIDPASSTNLIRVTSTSSLNIENTDNAAFSEDSLETAYAYPANFSMYVTGTSQTFNITQHTATITPSTDKLAIWNLVWDETPTFNASSDTASNPTWFNLTHSTWANRNIKIYRNGTIYANESADASGLMTYNYSDTYSEKYFEFESEEVPFSPIITLLSQTPSVINQATTGLINISYGVTHTSTGLNNTSISFIHRTYDHDYQCSNHSIRPPDNDLAADWNLNGRVLRASGRNETLNFENNASITGGDIYTWGGMDENNSEMTITPVNSTYTIINISANIHDILPNMRYLDKEILEAAPKTQIPIHKSQGFLFKFHQFEIYKGNTDYLAAGYMDTYLNPNPASQPSDVNPISFYLLNDSYDPATGGDPTTSPYGLLLGSLTASEWAVNDYSPHPNSSYTSRFINAATVSTVLTLTNTTYLYFISNTPSSKPFYLNVTDVASGTNRSFAETGVLWTGVTSPFTPAAYTPNSWFVFTKGNISIDHKLFVADNNDLWGNSTMNVTFVQQALFPPATPSFHGFEFAGYNDLTMDCTYRDTIKVRLNPGTDPDGGATTGNFTLHYANNQSLVATINASVPGGTGIVSVDFDTSPYYSTDVLYTLKCTTTDDELATSERWLPVNFALSPLGTTGTLIDDSRVTFWGLDDFPALYTAVSNTSIVSESGGIYTLHTSLHHSQYGDLWNISSIIRIVSINDINTPYYRLTGTDLFDGAHITSWNETTNAPALSTDEYRSYMYSDRYYSSVSIINSNLSYFGQGISPFRGVYVQNAEGSVINNNTFIGNDYGVSLVYGGNFSVTNNTIINSNVVSLEVSNVAVNVSVRDNNVISQESCGINIENSNGVTMINNSLVIDNTSCPDYEFYNSPGNTIRNPFDTTNSISMLDTASSVIIENTDSQVFTEDGSNTSYAYTNGNYSLSISGVVETITITQQNMTVLPSTDEVTFWNGVFGADVTFNASSETSNNPTWLNVTNSNWIGNTVDVYVNGTLNESEISVDGTGLVTFNYSEEWSEKYFRFTESPPPTFINLSNPIPLSGVEIDERIAQPFTITSNVLCNSTWTLDGYEVDTDNLTINPIYTIPTNLAVRAHVLSVNSINSENSSDSDSYTWYFTVERATISPGGGGSGRAPSIVPTIDTDPLDNIICSEKGFLRNIKINERISYVVRDEECLLVTTVSFIPSTKSTEQPVHIEALKDRSIFVTENVPHYEILNFNLFVGLSGYDDRTEQEKIFFRLRKDSIEEAGLDETSVKLYKWSTEKKTWIQKYTDLTDSDEYFYYYEADSGATTGRFAISSKETDEPSLFSDLVIKLPGLGHMEFVIPEIIRKPIVEPFINSIERFINDMIAEYAPSLVPKEDSELIAFTTTGSQETSTESKNSNLNVVTIAALSLILIGVLSFYFNSNSWNISMMTGILIIMIIYLLFGVDMITVFNFGAVDLFVNVILIALISYLAPIALKEFKEEANE